MRQGGQMTQEWPGRGEVAEAARCLTLTRITACQVQAMTAQVYERLIYDGSEHMMAAEPLSDYFTLGGHDPGFVTPHTACWRGYVGTWEVVGDRLYLVDLEGQLTDGSKGSVESVFPGQGGRVFADWFTGTIRVPQGEQLSYIHAGWGSIFERDLLLRFDEGRLVEKSIRENDVPEC